MSLLGHPLNLTLRYTNKTGRRNFGFYIGPKIIVLCFLKFSARYVLWFIFAKGERKEREKEKEKIKYVGMYFSFSPASLRQKTNRKQKNIQADDFAR